MRECLWWNVIQLLHIHMQNPHAARMLNTIPRVAYIQHCCREHHIHFRRNKQSDKTPAPQQQKKTQIPQQQQKTKRAP